MISYDSSASQVVGNLMTFSYLMGLTLGSLLSYWLDSLLDSPGSPCRGLGDQGTTSPRYHRSHQSPTYSFPQPSGSTPTSASTGQSHSGLLTSHTKDLART